MKLGAENRRFLSKNTYILGLTLDIEKLSKSWVRRCENFSNDIIITYVPKKFGDEKALCYLQAIIRNETRSSPSFKVSFLHKKRFDQAQLVLNQALVMVKLYWKFHGNRKNRADFKPLYCKVIHVFRKIQKFKKYWIFRHIDRFAWS